MASTAARLLREARRRGGLTQAQLARRAGTSQSAVSAYEAGRKDPSVDTLARLLAAAGSTLAGVPAPQSTRDFVRTTTTAGLPRPDSLAVAAQRVIGGEDLWHVLREFLDGLGLVAHVEGPAAVAGLVHEPPRRTGDEGVDALLGGLAEHLATKHALPRPSWCADPARFLERWWFPHRRRAFDAVALRDAPAAFRRRGVFLHPSALERV